MFSEVIDELLPPSTDDGGDTFDILMRQVRKGKPWCLILFQHSNLVQREQAEQENTGEGQDTAHQLPALLRRRYHIYFSLTEKQDVLQIRNIRAANIGSLVKFKVFHNLVL